METTRELSGVLEELKESGYQLTPQRRKVIQRCLDHHNGHFTAEDLQDLEGDQSKKEFSRATVYNTLNILVEVGFLRELHNVDNSSYYEVTGNLHPHARCTVCGSILDVPVNLEDEVDSWDVPFRIHSIRMTLEGVCPDCSEQWSHSD